MPPRLEALVLADGDVPGLLALAAATTDSTARVLAWPALTPDPVTAQARREAATRQAELLGAGLFGPPPTNGAEESDAGISGLLLRAAHLAARLGCSKVVWPVSAGTANLGPEAAARIAAALDRALLVTRLVRLDFTDVEIQTPYADLSDRQLADLILDMDLPLWTCWWYAPRPATDPAFAAAGGAREHWSARLAEAGWRGPLPGPAVETPGGANATKETHRA
jgi:hypothetical protein